jgi:hypothetical protein
MAASREISGRCLEQLHTWILAHSPAALLLGEFMPGLLVIIREEIDLALTFERQRLLEQLLSPSQQ